MNHEILSPIGNVESINRLSSLLSRKKSEGDLVGFSFLADSSDGVTAGELADEIDAVYSDYISGHTVNITDQIMSGMY